MCLVKTDIADTVGIVSHEPRGSIANSLFKALLPSSSVSIVSDDETMLKHSASTAHHGHIICSLVAVASHSNVGSDLKDHLVHCAAP